MAPTGPTSSSARSRLKPILLVAICRADGADGSDGADGAAEQRAGHAPKQGRHTRRRSSHNKKPLVRSQATIPAPGSCHSLSLLAPLHTHSRPLRRRSTLTPSRAYLLAY